MVLEKKHGQLNQHEDNRMNAAFLSFTAGYKLCTLSMVWSICLLADTGRGAVSYD